MGERAIGHHDRRASGASRHSVIPAVWTRGRPDARSSLAPGRSPAARRDGLPPRRRRSPHAPRPARWLVSRSREEPRERRGANQRVLLPRSLVQRERRALRIRELRDTAAAGHVHRAVHDLRRPSWSRARSQRRDRSSRRRRATSAASARPWASSSSRRGAVLRCRRCDTSPSDPCPSPPGSSTRRARSRTRTPRRCRSSTARSSRTRRPSTDVVKRHRLVRPEDRDGRALRIGDHGESTDGGDVGGLLVDLATEFPRRARPSRRRRPPARAPSSEAARPALPHPRAPSLHPSGPWLPTHMV